MRLLNRNHKPVCPVNAEQKSFVESSYQWLIDQFGPVEGRSVIIPDQLNIPQVESLEVLIQKLLKFCCQRMEISPDLIHLEFYQIGNTNSHLEGGVQFDSHYSLGEYNHWNEETGKFEIQINTNSFKTLEQGICNLVHQLSYVKLIGEDRIKAEDKSLEFLAELTVIYFGFGIFQANSSLVHNAWGVGEWYMGWRISRNGSLPLEMAAHALAVHAYLQGEQDPKWVSQLGVSSKKMTERAIAYLFHPEDAKVKPARNPY